MKIGGDGVRSAEEIERDIEYTRDELADTVAELSQRANIKKMAGERVRSAREGAKPYAIGTALILVAALAAIVVVRRRRKNSSKWSRFVAEAKRALPRS